MELLIVHLTDIHIKDDQDFDVVSDRVSSLSGAICNHITEPDDAEVLLCVTGDLAFSGQKNQYIAIDVIIEEIYSIIKKRFPKVGIHLVFVPGNHDCDFRDASAAVREVILDSPTLDITDRSQLQVCTEIQKNYFTFVSEWHSKYGAMSCQPDRILTVNEIKFDERNINLNYS